MMNRSNDVSISDTLMNLRDGHARASRRTASSLRYGDWLVSSFRNSLQPSRESIERISEP
jgi:hypothetical protein